MDKKQMARLPRNILGVVLVILLRCTPSFAQSALSIHGYLTQAYAYTDGHQLFGIPHEGTTDYRALALQFRYAIGAKDDIIIQFSHKRMGLSPAMSFAREVAVDWAFARHRLSDATSITFGRVQIPMGIYNELRDVGTLLPFYRAPASLYRESTWVNEAIDGVVFAAAVKKNAPWNLEVQIFYGGWDSIEDPMTGTGELFQARNKNGAGTQLWLNTPVDGLRLGTQVYRYDATGILHGAGKKDTYEAWMVSLDASLARAIVQSEYQSVHFPQGNAKVIYTHAGVKLTEKLSIHGQAELLHVLEEISQPFVTLRAERTVLREYSAGTRYSFHSNIVLKAETHWMDGLLSEDDPQNFFFGVPSKTRYTIISLSASF